VQEPGNIQQFQDELVSLSVNSLLVEAAVGRI
jgi:hypothetical protein